MDKLFIQLEEIIDEKTAEEVEIKSENEKLLQVCSEKLFSK